MCLYMYTVNSPNCRHFGTQASVLYSESVLYSGVWVISISSPIHVTVVVTVIMLFEHAHLEILFRGYHCTIVAKPILT